jgi:anti-anti-sigma factor
VIVFEIWKDNGIGLIEPDGALTGDAIPALRQALDEATQLAARHTIVIIDGAVTTFDATALGALLIRHARLQRLGGTLAVIGTTGEIARLLRLVAVGDSVPIFAGLDEALATLTGKADQ